MSLVEEYKDLQFYSKKSIATSEPCHRYMPTSAQAAGELRVNALLKLLELEPDWDLQGYLTYEPLSHRFHRDALHGMKHAA